MVNTKKIEAGIEKPKVLGLVSRHYLELLFLSAFLNMMVLAVPIFVLQVYDRVVAQQGLTTLAGLALGMVGVLAFDHIFRHARSRVLQRAAMKVEVLLNKALYSKVSSLPLRTLEARTPSQWTSSFRDIDAIRNTLGGQSAVLVSDLPFALVFLGFVWIIATPVAWVLTAVVPLFILLALVSSWRLSKLTAVEREATQKRDVVLGDLMGGRQTMKSLNLGPALREDWEEGTSEAVENAMVRGRSTDSFSFIGSSLAMTTTVVMTCIGALAILDQQMTIGSLIAANILSSRTVQPFTQLVSGWRSFAMFKQASKRLDDVFDLAEDARPNAIKLEKPKGEYRLENVRFAFAPTSAPALDGIGLGLRPGGLHGIIGKNGSGKTTLLKVLAGLYEPQIGRVLVDGADLSQVSRAQLAEWIGYVPLETYFFRGSIHDNIAHGKIGATDQEVIDAARLACAHDAIVDLPDGYSTVIGDGGFQLSAGQGQRIGLARAMIGDPPILLLDEPTSQLDAETERQLAETLLELAKTHMVIVVTHSPGLVRLCTDVVAMEKGRAVAAGPLDQVLTPEGRLRKSPRLVDPKEAGSVVAVNAIAGGGKPDGDVS